MFIFRTPFDFLVSPTFFHHQNDQNKCEVFLKKDPEDLPVALLPYLICECVLAHLVKGKKCQLFLFIFVNTEKNGQIRIIKSQ